MATKRTVTPGYAVVFPNREKASSKTTTLAYSIIAFYIFPRRGGGSLPTAAGLAVLLLLIVPVQALLILLAPRAFAHRWNVEAGVPIDEARSHGYNPPDPGSGEPVTP